MKLAVVAFALLAFLAGLFFFVVELALGEFALLALMGGHIQEKPDWTLLTNFLLFIVKRLFRTFFAQAGCLVKMCLARAEETFPVS